METRENLKLECMYYKWRRKYGGSNIDHEKIEKIFRLKKTIAELTIDRLIFNEALRIEGSLKFQSLAVSI